MKKIMFSDAYKLTEAVLSGRKTQTRRIVKVDVPLGNWSETMKYSRYKVGEIVAVAQSYKDAGVVDCPTLIDNVYYEAHHLPGWSNKMFVRADLMPHQIRITNVRMERLQDISDEDCKKEGIDSWTCQGKRYFGFFDYTKDKFIRHKTSREAYAALIDRIAGKGTWQSNPHVFVYDF